MAQIINYFPKNLTELKNLIKNNEDTLNIDTCLITDMHTLFAGSLFNKNMFNQPLKHWDVSNVTNMSEMFRCAYNFNQPLDNWDVSNVTDMHEMFKHAKNFNQPLNDWDVSNVTDMHSMFWGAKSFNQPLNDWDVSNVTTMNRMFAYTENFNQSLNNWNVSNVVDMYGMFLNAKKYKYSMSNWKVLYFPHDIIKNCYSWKMYNTDDDMPMYVDKNARRMMIPDGVKNIWHKI